jgi:hypothetical protein
MKNQKDARETLQTYFLEMRARIIEIAASLDRIERAPGGQEVMKTDSRVALLRDAIKVLGASGCQDRAEQAQLIFSLKE